MGQDETLLPVTLSSGKAWYQKVGDWFNDNLGFIIVGGPALGLLVSGAKTFGEWLGNKHYIDSTSGRVYSLTTYDKTAYAGLKTLYLPVYTLTSEEIFKGNILLFNINFFNNKKEMHVKFDGGGDMTLEAWKKSQQVSETGNMGQFGGAGSFVKYYFYYDDNGNEVITSQDDTATNLSKTVSQWYNALRNIAIVLMLSILLYIGIRMLLSSVAQDKAKYKQMLTDWFVGMCLLFFMHYIMAFSVELSEQFIKVVQSIGSDKYAVLIQDDDNHYLSDGIKELGKDDIVNNNYVVWNTNLLGKLRIACQMNKGKVEYIGYAICFLILVFYTVFFAFTYLKRVIYMAFLTIIAPMVAMTYPIDKINDGQAQAFNKWLKEYIFNLLIQPVHLILYTMLVSSAFELASQNVWYMIVAIGFMVPAEKLLRSLFGFEKAATPGSFAGAAVGAGLVSRGLGGVLGHIPGGNGNHGGDNKKLGKGNDDDDPRIKKLKVKDDNLDPSNDLLGSMDFGDDLKGEKDKEEGLGEKILNKPEQPNGQMGDQERKTRALNINPNANAQNMRRLGTDVSSLNKPQNVDKKNNQQKDNKNKEMPRRNIKKPQVLVKSGKPKAQNKRPGTFKRLRRAAGAGVRRTFSGPNLRKMARFGGNLGKKAIRFTGKAAGATLAGTIGVAAGIASGDASNALQYGLTAGIAGAAAGGRVADGGMNLVGGTVQGVRNISQGPTVSAMQEAYYGEDRKDELEEKKREKAIKEWKKNDEKRAKLEEEIGYQDTAEMYKNNEIDDYWKYGIEDAKEIKKMHKLNKQGVKVNEYLGYGIQDAKDIKTLETLKQEGIAKDTEQAIAIHAYSQRTGDTTKLSDKKKDEYQKTFKNEFMKKNGRSEADAEKASVETMRRLYRYNEIKNNIRDDSF